MAGTFMDNQELRAAVDRVGREIERAANERDGGVSCEASSTTSVGRGERAADGSNMEHAMRLIHWYDLDRRTVACGAPGHSNSTKHHRDVTCTACLACLEERRASVRLVPSSDPLQ